MPNPEDKPLVSVTAGEFELMLTRVACKVVNYGITKARIEMQRDFRAYPAPMTDEDMVAFEEAEKDLMS